MAILEKVRADSEFDLPIVKKYLRDKYGKDVHITVEKNSNYRETQEYSWRDDSHYISRKDITTIIVIAEDDSPEPEPEPKPQKSAVEMVKEMIASGKLKPFKKTSTAR